MEFAATVVFTKDFNNEKKLCIFYWVLKRPGRKLLVPMFYAHGRFIACLDKDMLSLKNISFST